MTLDMFVHRIYAMIEMIKSLLFFSFAFLVFLLIPHPVYAEVDEYGRELPEKMVPKKIKVEQLHKDYREKNHRYGLRITGDHLKNRGIAILAEWKTNCGRFYSKYNGILEMEKPVIWGYEFPKEDCTDVVITVKIKDYLRDDEANIDQKIFFPEDPPIVKIHYTKHLTPEEVKRKDFWRWVKIKIGSWWASLKPGDDNAATTELPGGVTSVRD